MSKDLSNDWTSNVLEMMFLLLDLGTRRVCKLRSDRKSCGVKHFILIYQRLKSKALIHL